MKKGCWEVKTSVKYGKKYYINKEKGTSQWGTSFDTEDNILPDGWEMHQSKSGDYYFGYKGTVFQWEKPKEQIIPTIYKKFLSNCGNPYYLNTKNNRTYWEIDANEEEEDKPLINNDFQIPWIKESGKFNLFNLNMEESRQGNYKFNPLTLKLITGIQGSYNQTSTVMYTKCMVKATDFKETNASIEPKITRIIGNIQTEIQTVGKRHKIFVLPSQLNAAEYVNDNTIITDVDAYKFDETGGPMGQLSADPGVAQFILDNACNQNTGDEKGINNVRLMGKINGVSLYNGYLKVKDKADVEFFKKVLPNMTIFGVRDVPVRGLDSKMEHFVNMNHKVDLIYASAVPYGNLKNGKSTYGNSTHNNVRIIAKLTLFAQYVGSMRLAISRGNCDLILMPLGGGAFKNQFSDIKMAIINAYNFLEKELIKSKVKVYLLLYEENQEEIDFFK